MHSFYDCRVRCWEVRVKTWLYILPPIETSIHSNIELLYKKLAELINFYVICWGNIYEKLFFFSLQFCRLLVSRISRYKAAKAEPLRIDKAQPTLVGPERFRPIHFRHKRALSFRAHDCGWPVSLGRPWFTAPNVNTLMRIAFVCLCRDKAASAACIWPTNQRHLFT